MDWATIFRALGHPHRLALFRQLLEGPGDGSCCEAVAPGENACCVVDFTRRLPLAQSTISHRLQVLVAAGLVTVESRGPYSVYRLHEPTLEAFKAYVAQLRSCRTSASGPPVACWPEG
ncbi:MAG: metalloregulator ArsR/SmtB family transcription factor [Firmicutes bacterium]|nr:metalloregulator ArsR/SmtB family transcription factor [Bacillota bacterium]